MSRATIILNTDDAKRKAIEWIRLAPRETRVEFKRSKRSLPQNARMWAMLTEISTQLRWHGMKLKPDQWKLVFMSGLRDETNTIINFSGNGFISLGYSTSDLSKDEMSMLMELIAEYGARHGVSFSEVAEGELISERQ